MYVEYGSRRKYNYNAVIYGSVLTVRNLLPGNGETVTLLCTCPYHDQGMRQLNAIW